ncbi:rCG60353 [Rattus norvegicus]|uniref:RCG60353 n=1 Tax=Rattus norvegicus TaxID=10116 RepID=A6KJH0_RAT|nr:rCG60353 [Rattus norvegicus]
MNCVLIIPFSHCANGMEYLIFLYMSRRCFNVSFALNLNYLSRDQGTFTSLCI